jgi:predicted nucleotidyltransferase
MLTAEEELIAGSITDAVGARPVILFGSRATDEATAGSDYDVFVVAPALTIPRILSRLRTVSARLERQVHANVTVNPLPRFRLQHPGPSLLLWKLRREGKVLRAPLGFDLGNGEVPALSAEAASSYALSGLRFLLSSVGPPLPAEERLSAPVQHDVRKAVLHLAQLALLRRGTYASRFDEALALLSLSAGDRELDELGGAVARPETWFRTRDRLIDEVQLDGPGAGRTAIANLQYVALSALSGRGLPLRTVAQRTSVKANLEKAVVLLAESVEASGGIDEGKLGAAAKLLPASPNQSSWAGLRDSIEAQWPNANPLAGL